MRNILFVLALVATLAFPALRAAAPPAPAGEAPALASGGGGGVTPDFRNLAFRGGLSATEVAVQQQPQTSGWSTKRKVATAASAIGCGLLGFVAGRNSGRRSTISDAADRARAAVDDFDLNEFDRQQDRFARAATEGGNGRGAIFGLVGAAACGFLASVMAKE